MITDFGAVGDGKTDNAEIFHHRIAQLPPVGGMIVIPHGELLIASPVVITSSFVTIRGMNHGLQSNIDTPVSGLLHPGGGSRQLLAPTALRGIAIPQEVGSRISGLMVKDLLIAGAGSGEGQTGIWIERDNDGTRIDNVTCINLYKAHTSRPPQHARIENCWLAECANGLHTEIGKQNLDTGCHMGAQPVGITSLLEGQEHLLFTGNVVFPGGYTALSMTGARNCQISGSVFSSYYTGIIEIEGNGNSLYANNIRAHKKNGSWSTDPIGRDDFERSAGLNDQLHGVGLEAFIVRRLADACVIHSLPIIASPFVSANWGKIQHGVQQGEQREPCEGEAR